MIITVKTIIFVVATIFISISSGYFVKKIFKTQDKDVINDFLVGLTIMLAIFEIECVVGVYLKFSLSLLTVLYGASIGIICVLGIIQKYKNKEKWFLLDLFRNSKDNIGLVACVCFLIGVQAFMIAFCMRQNTDDSSYIAITNTALETNTLLEYSQYTGKYVYDIWSLFKRSLSPFSLLMAVIEKYTGVHSAIAHHTILPMLVIPLGYVVYWKFSEMLFEKKKDRWLFLLFMCITNIYGAYSAYSTSVHFLTRIWQGKAIYAAIFIPWLIYRLICVCKTDTRYNWIILFVSAIAGILLSNVAVVGNIILIFVYMIYEFYKRRKWKYLWYGMVCCIPMLVCGLVMVVCMYKMGRL